MTDPKPNNQREGKMTTKLDAQFGLYEKFRVERTDGRSERGEKHDGCEYFVLDLDHDPFALPALLAYARHCGEEYPQLANDLFRKAEQITLRLAEEASR